MKKLYDLADNLDSQAQTIRREAARELRKQGKTFAEIATLLGISKARAHQLCQEEIPA